MARIIGGEYSCSELVAPVAVGSSEVCFQNIVTSYGLTARAVCVALDVSSARLIVQVADIRSR